MNALYLNKWYPSLFYFPDCITTLEMATEPEIATPQAEAIQTQKSMNVSSIIDETLADMDMLDEYDDDSKFEFDMEEHD